ncbi:MAG TPA: LysM peptidoglycan-binding domain-containing protein [Anaerolineales bacterium]|nr:LysM peptidoglycan-binding domain-containing protein [Anaerolineales bacterium]
MNHHNQPLRSLHLILTLLLGLLALSLTIPSVAAPSLQLTPFPTPTPGTDGRILYVVQPGDTLLRISLISGVSVDELRGLNNLAGDTIVAGQELLLGLGGPSQVSPTPGPSPTSTPLLPTPTVETGNGSLCILLFEDRNGDSIREEEEVSIPNGAISINNPSGSVSLTTATKSGLEHECFEELPEGEYSVTVAIPEGYNPTTPANIAVTLQAGDITYLSFGAQINSETQPESPEEPAQEGRSPTWGIIGGLFLLAGAGLALFAGRLLKGNK